MVKRIVAYFVWGVSLIIVLGVVFQPQGFTDQSNAFPSPQLQLAQTTNFKVLLGDPS
jgi:hypothetical protein